MSVSGYLKKAGLLSITLTWLGLMISLSRVVFLQTTQDPDTPYLLKNQGLTKLDEPGLIPSFFPLGLNYVIAIK